MMVAPLYFFIALTISFSNQFVESIITDGRFDGRRIITTNLNGEITIENGDFYEETPNYIYNQKGDTIKSVLKSNIIQNSFIPAKESSLDK